MKTLSARVVRRWYRIHKWSSLVCTAFLLMACITGLPLIFHDELDQMFHQEVRPTEVPAGTPLANLDAMVKQAKVRLPNLQPYSLFLDDDEPRVVVIMTPTPKPEKFEQVSFDAHTGKLLEAAPIRKDLLSWLLTLHRALFLDLPGELLMGVMALLLIVSLVSGALVYGPFMRRLSFGTVRTQPTRLRWFDLHNLLGIATICWALVIGATGVMNALSTPLFGLWQMRTLPPILKPFHGRHLPQQLTSVDDAVARTAALLPGMRVTSVLFPNGIVASPRHFVVWTQGNSPLTSRLLTPMLIDAETGLPTVVGGLPWYLRVLELSRPLHFGDYGGLPLKILWALFDAVLIAVLGSGVYLWLSRRKTPVEGSLDQLVLAEQPWLPTTGAGPMKENLPFRRVYGIPILLAVVTLSGLLSALVGDGLWDEVSWGILALPLLIFMWYFFLRQPSSFATNRRR